VLIQANIYLGFGQQYSKDLQTQSICT